MEMLAGWRAVSLAGNDKGRVYVCLLYTSDAADD